MAEDRNTYTIREDGGVGTVKIADEVVAVIAGLAATEVKGVASLDGGIVNSMIARKGLKTLSRGVRVDVQDNLVTIDLKLNLEYGYSIPDVGTKVQEKVKDKNHQKSQVNSISQCLIQAKTIHVVNILLLFLILMVLWNIPISI